MVKHIYTLNSKFNNKKIYIWDIAKSAITVFSRLAYRNIEISGFVTDRNEFVGDTIMNRPIIHLEEFGNIKDAIILCDDEMSSATLQKVCKYGEGYFFSDVMELHSDLYSTSHYIYGIGDGAWKILKIFQEKGITIKGFLLTKKQSPNIFLGLPVYEYGEIELTDKDSIIISAITSNVSCDILDYIQKCDYCGSVFIEEYLSYRTMWSVNLFQMLDNAIKLNKKVLLCSEDNMSRELIRNILKTYSIEINREVCYQGDVKRGLDDIYSLADEEVEQCVLIIIALQREKRYQIVAAANDLGFSPELLNYASIHRTCYNGLAETKKLVYESDKLLGVSIDYTGIGGKPGWAIYGNETTADIRIMVLGGSTSSEIYYPENWVSKLYHLCQKAQMNVVIFNGAHESNDVISELLRTIRDIHSLKPNIVISMSGVNNLKKFDTCDKFFSSNNETAFELWYRIEKYLKLISESEGSEFFAILQPINIYMPHMSLKELLQFPAEADNNLAESFFLQSRKDDFYYNLFDLFHHKESRFLDNCHYTNTANEELAKAVFGIITRRN